MNDIQRRNEVPPSQNRHPVPPKIRAFVAIIAAAVAGYTVIVRPDILAAWVLLTMTVAWIIFGYLPKSLLN